MFKILDEACTPTKGSKYSAAVDLRAARDITIAAGETGIVGLGVCIDLDKLLYRVFKESLIKQKLGTENSFHEKVKELHETFKSSHYIQLEPRSSVRAKGLIVGTGVIDLDFRDELKLIVHNPVRTKQYVQNGQNYTVLLDDDDNEFTIKKGDKIAQVMLCEHKSFLFGVNTDKARTGGFGSTGHK